MVLRLAAAGRLSLSFARLIPRKGEGVIGVESPLISSGRVRSDARISVLGQEIGANSPWSFNGRCKYPTQSSGLWV